MKILGVSNRKAAVRLIVAVALGIEVITSMPMETLSNYNEPDKTAVNTYSLQSNMSYTFSSEDDYFDIFPPDKTNSANKLPGGGVRPDKDYSLELNDFGVKPEPNLNIDIGGLSPKSPFSNKLIALGSTQKPAAPRFMLDIFNLFDQDRSMQPSSNIIRSFTNKGKNIYFIAQDIFVNKPFRKIRVLIFS